MDEKIKKELEKIKKEKQELFKQMQVLDNQRNQVLTRLIEIQGILKYLEEKDKEICQK